MTDKGVAALKPRATRYAVSDPELRGHMIRVSPNGDKNSYAITRNPDGKQKWTLIGPADTGIATLREKARTVLQRVRDGLPAFEPRADSFGAVVASWQKRHVEKNRLRSAKEIKRLLDVHVLPVWKDREFTSIRRSDVATLLDGIEDDHGARQADLVLGVVRAIMNWHATRDDEYRPSVVKGMGRAGSPKKRARSRTLDDNEIRAVWKVAEADGTFGALVRLLLLTAQRRIKVATMRWADIAADGTWTIATEAREKGNAEELVLPQLAFDIIQAQPRFDGSPYILSGRGKGHFNSLSDGKRAFDRKLAGVLPDMPQWQLHDLRRTARSLMSRAGVSSEHAERVMGHALPTIEGTYNQHQFRDEKAEALKRLAALIDSIVHPQPAVVVPLESERSRRRL